MGVKAVKMLNVPNCDYAMKIFWIEARALIQYKDVILPV